MNRIDAHQHFWRYSPETHGWIDDSMAVLKRVCDDLKAYHYEAVAAQPGKLSPKEIDRWFWFETATAKVFLAIREACLKSEDKSLQPLGRLTLIPRAIGHALTR